MKGKIGWLDFIAYYCYLVLIWGVFRLTVQLPLVWEEVIFKPLIWGLPLISMWMVEKNRPKLFEGKTLKAVLWGVGLGLGYGTILFVNGRLGNNALATGVEAPKVLFDVVGIGLVTAIVEEVVFAGYILSKIARVFSFWTAGGLTALLFSLIHVPIGVFVYQYSDMQMIGFLGLVGIVAMGHYWVMNKTKNVLAPILCHWIWIVMVGLWG